MATSYHRFGNLSKTPGVSGRPLFEGGSADDTMHGETQPPGQALPPDMVEKAFYVGEHGWVTILCPHCGKSKDLEACKLPPEKRKLRVRCKCQQVFVASIEYRKKFRKDVQLPGEYVNLDTEDWGKIVVEDISMGGIGFSTVKRHDIKVGDQLELTFTLDTSPPRAVSKKVRVLRVDKFRMGSHYVMRMERDPDIGLYLMV